MRRFIIERSEEDLTSHAGLALTGMAVNRYTELAQSLKRGVPLRHGISHADVLRSYPGLLCLGKSDFEAVSNVREDEFFAAALNVGAVPSAETLRQRMDERAEVFLPLVSEASVSFLENAQVPCTLLRHPAKRRRIGTYNAGTHVSGWANGGGRAVSEVGVGSALPCSRHIPATLQAACLWIGKPAARYNAVSKRRGIARDRNPVSCKQRVAVYPPSVTEMTKPVHA